jgi:cytochrome c oxidase subunit 3
MTITLIFLAAIMGTLIAWLLRQSINVQPWVTAPAGESAPETDEIDASAATVGLGTFLAVATALFALFISAYALRMELPDWIPLNEPQLLWWNTGALVLASIVFQWTRNAAGRGDLRRVQVGQVLGGLFTILFLLGQSAAWQQLTGAGYFIYENPANAFFYLLTALHALHVLGGMWVWGRTTFRVIRGGFKPEAVRASVELCTIYWHFLLLVWFVLFWLLLST